MKRYLLDTCICVFLFRQKYGMQSDFRSCIRHNAIFQKSRLLS